MRRNRISPLTSHGQLFLGKAVLIARTFFPPPAHKKTDFSSGFFFRGPIFPPRKKTCVWLSAVTELGELRRGALTSWPRLNGRHRWLHRANLAAGGKLPKGRPPALRYGLLGVVGPASVPMRGGTRGAKAAVKIGGTLPGQDRQNKMVSGWRWGGRLG